MSNNAFVVKQQHSQSLLAGGTSIRVSDEGSFTYERVDDDHQMYKHYEGTAKKRSNDKESPKKRKNLLHFRDMPPHLQFNPYIFTGYRPLLTFWGSINSLFYLHNETINILTHGIPIVYILVTVPGLMPWEHIESRFLPWCHIIGAVSPWIGSFVYHLFMNLERGEVVYYKLLQLDMLGIWISQSFVRANSAFAAVLPIMMAGTFVKMEHRAGFSRTRKINFSIFYSPVISTSTEAACLLCVLLVLLCAGALPMVYASVFCLSRVCRWLILSSYCLLSMWGLYKALTAWSPWERRLCFLLPFVMRVLLCGLRYSPLGGGDPASLVHVILQDAVSALGGAIGAMHIPEKWFPGTVDMYLNSHNIMHVLVVMAVYSMHQATVQDLLWMAHVDCRTGHQPTDTFGGLQDAAEL